METRTYYVPANRIGRQILNYIVTRVSCSIGQIYRVTDNLAVPITTTKREISKIERILQMYDLM